MEKYNLGKFRPMELAPEVCCAFEIQSHSHYRNCVYCFFDSDGNGRFIRLMPRNPEAKVLDASWVFVLYMIIPFLQELATEKRKIDKQAEILKQVAALLDAGWRKVL